MAKISERFNNFEALISKAEEKNFKVWDCLLEIYYNKQTKSLELDQYFEGENDLFQQGETQWVNSSLNYKTTLN